MAKYALYSVNFAGVRVIKLPSTPARNACPNSVSERARVPGTPFQARIQSVIDLRQYEDGPLTPVALSVAAKPRSQGLPLTSLHLDVASDHVYEAALPTSVLP
jgi:hypothetical protein